MCEMRRRESSLSRHEHGSKTNEKRGEGSKGGGVRKETGGGGRGGRGAGTREPTKERSGGQGSETDADERVDSWMLPYFVVRRACVVANLVCKRDLGHCGGDGCPKVQRGYPAGVVPCIAVEPSS
jgi:hypothetical protein